MYFFKLSLPLSNESEALCLKIILHGEENYAMQLYVLDYVLYFKYLIVWNSWQ